VLESHPVLSEHAAMHSDISLTEKKSL